MRTLLALFRFVLRLQGAVVEGGRIRRDEGVVEIRVRRRRNAEPRCAKCKTRLGGKITWHERRWRHLDIMRVRTEIIARIREGRCPRCQGRRMEGVPWASARARHTRVFDRLVGSLVQVADKSAASRMFAVSWRTVGRIVTRVVKESLPKGLLDGLEAIGVDEVSYKRNHHYLTVVSCLLTGRVVWVAEGKTEATLAGFFRDLGEERSKKIEVVAMDMSQAYVNAVKSHAPQADIIFDRFHVVQLLLKAIDEIRRDECRKAQGEARVALKKTRFALLRNPKHRTPKDLEAIKRVEASNGRLFRAYELRVSFEELWEYWNGKAAEKYLMRWTRSALLSRLEPLRVFAKTVREHMEGILNFNRSFGLTNAVLEGTNNKVKLIIHRAFGFRRVSALNAMIHLCCSGITLP